MAGYLAEPAIFWSTLVFVAAVATAVLSLLLRKSKKPNEIVTSEWQATGKIDFHCAEAPKYDKPAAFLLRVEDRRTVESISGVEHVKIRWRNATLAEAKDVVVAYQNAIDTGAKVYQFPKQHPPTETADSEAPQPLSAPPQPPHVLQGSLKSSA
jgi:hypothetical protein